MDSPRMKALLVRADPAEGGTGPSVPDLPPDVAWILEEPADGGVPAPGQPWDVAVVVLGDAPERSEALVRALCRRGQVVAIARTADGALAALQAGAAFVLPAAGLTSEVLGQAVRLAAAKGGGLASRGGVSGAGGGAGAGGLSLAWLQGFVASVGVVVAALDEHGRIVHVLGRWGATPVDPEGWRGGDPCELLGIDAAAFRDAHARALRGETARTEGTSRTHEGPLHYQGIYAPLPKGLNENARVAVVWRQTTDEVAARAERLLAERTAPLVTFAGGVAHQINNPLATIIANIDFILRELAEGRWRPAAGHGVASREPGVGGETRGTLAPAPATGRRDEVGQAGTAREGVFGDQGDGGEKGPAVDASLDRAELAELVESLQDARDSADRIRRLVRDLQRYVAPAMEQREPVDVNRLLDSVLSLLWKSIQFRARLVKDFGRLPKVLGNEARLRELFVNLVKNATQAIPEGDAEHNEIRVITSQDAAGNVRVAVRDTGVGIPEEHLEHVFDPFFTAGPHEGTGLGLPLARRVATEHGGSISLESEPGAGTTATVTLPSVRAPSEERASAATREPGRKRGRVLVVDDEPALARAIRRSLLAEHDVTIVGSAAEAMRLLQAGTRFDAIVCDLIMPGMNGMELYERVRALDPDAASRMIFLTGGASVAEAREFLDRVPNPRIEKPFEGKNLAAIVGRMVP